MQNFVLFLFLVIALCQLEAVNSKAVMTDGVMSINMSEHEAVTRWKPEDIGAKLREFHFVPSVKAVNELQQNSDEMLKKYQNDNKIKQSYAPHGVVAIIIFAVFRIVRMIRASKELKNYNNLENENVAEV